MKANKRQLLKLTIATFLMGVAIGGGFEWMTYSKKFVPDPPWAVNIPIIPGAILVAPIYVLTGGVHGSFTLVEWAFVPLNGAGYAMIALLCARIARKWKSKRTAKNPDPDIPVH